MKQLPVDFLGFTEIGGVGEMIYTAVRFPAYVAEPDEQGNNLMIPLSTGMHAPEAGNDYRLTGQDLLVSLCNLYHKINTPGSTVMITEAVREWCTDNILPYNNEVVCELLESGPLAHITLGHIIKMEATFDIDQFVKDLCDLGMAFELYYVLRKAFMDNDVSFARNLYYEGRICDSFAFLEKYRQYESDEEYLKQLKADRVERMTQLIDLFPDFRMRLKMNRRSKKIEYGADVYSVFDICWYAFGRLVADVAPPADYGIDDEFSQASILSCLACGSYFLRRSSRQRYCQSWECQAERNRRNRRASYAKHKNDLENE